MASYTLVYIAFLLVLCVLSLGVHSSISGVAFARREGGIGQDEGQKTVMAPDGSLLVAGVLGNNATIESQDFTRGIFLAKYNARTGECIWVIGVPVSGNANVDSLVVDSEGSAIIGGYALGNVQYSKHDQETFQNQAIFLAKYDNQGQYLWHAISEAGTTLGINHLVLSGDDLLVSGFFCGNSTLGTVELVTLDSGCPLFLVKYNASSGECLEAKTIGGGGISTAASFAVASDGSLFMGGAVQYGVEFCPGYSITPPSYYLHAYIVKFDQDWNCQFLLDFGGKIYNHPRDMKIGSDGFLYATGIFKSHITIGLLEMEPRGGVDVFLAKFHPQTGEPVWVTQIGGTGDEESYEILVEEDRVYVTGSFSQSAFFDEKSYAIAQGKTDSYIACYNANNGSIIWLSTNGADGSEVSTTGITGFGGNYYLTGSFTGSAVFRAFELTAEDDSDVLLLRYSNHTCFGISFTNSSVCFGEGDCVEQNECVCRNGYSGPDCSIEPASTPTPISTESPMESSPIPTESPVASSTVVASSPVAASSPVVTPSPSLPGQESSEFPPIPTIVSSDFVQCYGVDSKDPLVCNGNGTCIANDTCECTHPFSGDQCNILPPTTDRGGDRNKIIGIAVGTSVGGVILILFILLIIIAVIVLFIVVTKLLKKKNQATSVAEPATVTV